LPSIGNRDAPIRHCDRHSEGSEGSEGAVTGAVKALICNNIGLDPASYPSARQADINADGGVDLLDLIAARNHMTGQEAAH